MDLNLATFQWSCQALRNYSFEVTSDYQTYYNESEYLDWRNKLLPATISQEFPTLSGITRFLKKGPVSFHICPSWICYFVKAGTPWQF